VVLIRNLRSPRRSVLRSGGRAQAWAAILLLGGTATATMPSWAAVDAAPRLGSARIVFATRGDIWLYGPGRGPARRVTKDGSAHLDSSPRFVGAGEIAFVRDGNLVRLDLRSRRIRIVVRRLVLAYAWDVRGDRVAVLVQPNGVGGHRLSLVRPPSDKPVVLRRFAVANRGGEGSTRPVDGERSLVWSRGRLLLVDTDLPRRAGFVHVLGVRGADLIRPRVGTHAGWRGGSIYYRDLSAPAWHLVELGRGTTSELAIHRGRMHPALSPDHRLLALDDGRAWSPGRPRRGCTCTIYVYDFRRRVERRVRAGLVAPAWISAGTLAATRVHGCSGQQCGMDVPMWVRERAGSFLGLDGGVRRAPGLSTLDAAVSLG
jgi:hypothetical protein